MGGDPIPGRPRPPTGSPVEMIILSRPCKLSKFIKTEKKPKDRSPSQNGV